MKVETLYFHEPYCRSYALLDGQGNCILFDCGHPAVLKYLSSHALHCEGLFLTHGHFDHINGLTSLPSPLPFPVFLAEEDVPCLEDPILNGSSSFFLPPVEVSPSKVNLKNFSDGEEIKLKHFKVKAIKTPFHTLGSSVFYVEQEKTLFSGDTLFHLSIGRTDLPHSCPRKMEESLRKIMLLPLETIFYPGHGRGATLEEERRFNPFLQYL